MSVVFWSVGAALASLLLLFLGILTAEVGHETGRTDLMGVGTMLIFVGGIAAKIAALVMTVATVVLVLRLMHVIG